MNLSIQQRTKRLQENCDALVAYADSLSRKNKTDNFRLFMCEALRREVSSQEANETAAYIGDKGVSRLLAEWEHELRVRTGMKETGGTDGLLD